MKWSSCLRMWLGEGGCAHDPGHHGRNVAAGLPCGWGRSPAEKGAGSRGGRGDPVGGQRVAFLNGALTFWPLKKISTFNAGSFYGGLFGVRVWGHVEKRKPEFQKANPEEG